MYIGRLQIKSVRNLSEVSLHPGSRLNFLVGKNASGKTAVLEAIYFLSRARSFRTSRIREVVQYGQEVLQVSARLQSGKSLPIATGIEKGNGKSVIRYNGEMVWTVSAQARQLPLVLMTPDSHQLITGTARQRRHWLDWAMFHVEPDYLTWWRTYHKSLRQRNALLHSARPVHSGEIGGWEQSMAKASRRIQAVRHRFVERLEEAYQTMLGNNFPARPDIRLQSGWPEGKRLLDLLGQNREQDRRAGHTRYGPHKADLAFYVENKHLGAVCSRGQVKLFVNTLLIAQAQVYEFYSKKKPVFLVDDFTAELDHHSQEQLLGLLDEQEAQVFLTATNLGRQNEINDRIPMFHVKHGHVSRREK